MQFRPEAVNTFRQIFNQSHEQIRNFEGCQHLELFQDAADPSTFATYSYWESEHHLHAYRHSTLFKEVWTETKKLFAGKPEAFSYYKVEN